MANITTIECTYDELRPRLASLIERHRIADDPVLFCYDVSAAPKSWLGYLWGDPEPYDYAHVITTRKLISARRSKVYRSIGSVSSMDLIDIAKVEAATAEHYGYTVTVQGADEGTLECPMSQEARAKFISVLERAVKDAKLRPSPPPQSAPEGETSPDAAERLQRLTRLFEQKLITGEEYQQRRKEILAQL